MYLKPNLKIAKQFEPWKLNNMNLKLIVIRCYND